MLRFNCQCTLGQCKMQIQICAGSKFNFWWWKYCTHSIELHFSTLLHEICDWFVNKSDSVHRMPLTGSQLIYCISDRDITKQIKPDTLSIMQICWPSVVKCCRQAFSPWATSANCGSTDLHDVHGIRHNLYSHMINSLMTCPMLIYFTISMTLSFPLIVDILIHEEWCKA